MRYWTEDEARAYLPRLRALLALLRRSAEASVRARGNGHAAITAPASPAPDEPEGSGDAPDDDALPAAMTPADALAELDANGIVLRDVAAGIVDFPALHPNGREVHLCWRRGEDDLGFWHLPDAGFAARRPLPLPPDL